jgi:hypothetical protein
MGMFLFVLVLLSVTLQVGLAFIKRDFRRYTKLNLGMRGKFLMPSIPAVFLPWLSWVTPLIARNLA